MAKRSGRAGSSATSGRARGRAVPPATTGRARGRVSRGSRAAPRNGRMAPQAETDRQEFEAIDIDPTLWNPDYSLFEKADHAKIVKRRLRIIADRAKTFKLAAIEQRQAQLREFFQHGAQVMLARNRAHAVRGLRALEAPQSTLTKQHWYEELLRATMDRRAAEETFHERLLMARINAEAIHNAHTARRFEKTCEVSL